ncbi:MAG: sensor histidine kinase [Huintestinicola sp.]
MSGKRDDSSSIAGQIAFHLQFSLLGTYILTDLFLLIAAIVSWAIGTERMILSEFDPALSRSLTIDMATGASASGPPSPSELWALIGSAVYSFGDNTVPAGEFLQFTLSGIGMLAGIQLAFWILRYLPEYFKAKKMLSPLKKMALTTSELTEAAHTSSYSFDDIESAIGSIDPIDSDVHISTGNRDLKQLENAINDLLDRMRAAYKSQSRFVSDASHELRTPIAVIKGYAGMLDRWGKTDSKVLEESITAIKNESENMNNLVEQLLFLARGDNGRQPVNMTAFSLSDMITEVYNEAEMIDADHRYTLDIREDIPIYADISMMKQTARILCDNAKKYTPSGNEIILRVKYTDGGLPSFEVQDTGIGIDAKDIPNIFDRFFRSDPARNRETGGTGLGLSIAKWIVDRHGGHFEVISYKDIGTRITVCLPKQSQAEPAPNRSVS